MLTCLRESFGDPLFVRSQRGILPTERALQLAAPLQQVLSEIEQMLQPRAFTPAEAEMRLNACFDRLRVARRERAGAA